VDSSKSGLPATKSKCRAEPSRSSENPLVLIIVFVLFAGGSWAGYELLQTIDVAGEFEAVQTRYDIFALFMAAVVGSALAFVAVSARWLKGLTDLVEVGRKETAFVAIAVSAVLVVVVVGSLFFVLNGPAGLSARLSRQARPISLVAAIGLIPGLACFVTIWSVATEECNWCVKDWRRVQLLNRLSSELHRLLTTFAAFLTLWVVAVGMRRQALLAADETLSIPIEEVLIFGLVFALVLGSLYLMASTAIDRRAAILSETFAPLPDPFPDDFSDFLRRREQVQQLLGTGRDARRSFESVVVIASPLLTAMIASALSSG
jgi:hypothetical protein